MKTARLTVVEGPDENLHQVFLLSKDRDLLLGRSTVCHFQMADPLVSSLHCYFRYLDGHFAVYDLLSANGIALNDQNINSSTVLHADLLKIGKSTLQFSEDHESRNLAKKNEGGKPKRSVFDLASDTSLGRLIKNSRDISICRLALKNRLLTYSQIRDLLQMQKKTESEKREIASLLISQKILTKEDIEKLLREHTYYKVRHKDICFSKVVLQNNMVPEEKIHECLSLQERYFQETTKIPRMGEILVQKGYITIHQNNQIIRAIKKQKEAKNSSGEDKD